MMRTVEVGGTGEALLELLAARGVRYFFAAGAGTDFPPIIEAYARREALSLPAPQPLAIAHEITAAAMAHGYAMVAGAPAFAMVHTIVGTANALGGLMNAARARAPMVLAAGRTPISEHGHRGSRSIGVHWAQESFDQAGMLREYVKWDYELRASGELETVIDRAFAIARSAPSGPVYLGLPLEVLADGAGPFTYSAEPRLRPNAPAVADERSVAAAAAALRRAENPIAVTAAAGRDPRAVQALVGVAELLGMPVVEHWPTHLNFPRDHPLHLGFDVAPLLADADVVLVCEADVPWIPRDARPAAGSVVVQIDEDPLYQRYPLRGFPTDVTLTGSVALSLEALQAALEAEGADRARVRARRERWRREHEAQRDAWRGAGAAAATAAPMDGRWISRCVGGVIGPEDIAVTEYVLDPTQTCFTRPGTWFNHSHAAGLGWAPGAALGAKLARPDATVVCCVGDGAWNFGVPVATHYTAATHRIPVLFVVYDNAGWAQTRKATLAFAPDGFAARAERMPLVELGPSPRYERICEAAGGYGERVEDPAALPAALERALRAVREEGRQALVNVACSRDR